MRWHFSDLRLFGESCLNWTSNSIPNSLRSTRQHGKVGRYTNKELKDQKDPSCRTILNVQLTSHLVSTSSPNRLSRPSEGSILKMREVHAILLTIAIASCLNAANEALVSAKAPENAEFAFVMIGRLVAGAVSVSIHRRISTDHTGVDPLFNIFISAVVPFAVHQFWV